jgi:hypothetical protein
MEFRVLGPIEVVVGGELVPIGGAKERGLLARLVLSPNRLVGVSRLVEDLWADGGPADPSGALQVHVSRVRRALRSVNAQHVLQSRAGGYLVATPAKAVDAVCFEALSAKARRAAEHADFPGGARWREALTLWRGPALATAAGAPFAAIEGAAGIAALAGRQWDIAEAHFRSALRQAAEMPHRVEEAHTRRWYGQMFLERGGPDDLRLGSETLAAAIDDYERMSMPRHREITRALLVTGVSG